MAYEWAPLTPYGGTLLQPGYWFFEARLSAMTPEVIAEIHSIAPISEVIEDPSRDWFFALARVEGSEDKVIPPDATRAVGHFQRMPNGKTLNEVKGELYGTSMLEPQGFLEWLATNHPTLSQVILDGAVFVKDTAKGIGFGLGGIAAMGLGLIVALRLLKGGK